MSLRLARKPDEEKGGSGVTVMRLEGADQVASVDVVPAELDEDDESDE